MPSNSDKIRMTFWLPREDYQNMHENANKLDENHAQFLRRAVQKENERVEKQEQKKQRPFRV